MKNKVPVFASMFLLGATSLHAQLNVGSTTAPTGGAMLQVSQTSAASKLGFLPPQLVLTATSIAAPVSAPADGLVVYNTTAGGSGATAVVAGYYYWNNALSQWVNFTTSSSALASGNIYANDGTITGSGTRTVSLNGNAINFTGGNIGLGTATPLSTLEIPAGSSITSLTADNAFVKVGPSSAQHLIIDNQTIQAKADAATAGYLMLNNGGGHLAVGLNAGSSTALDIGGNLRLDPYNCPVNTGAGSSYQLVAADIAYSVFVVSDTHYTSSITLPTGASNGQILHVINNASSPLTVSGTNTDNTAAVTLVSAGTNGLHGATYIYLASLWIHMQ